MARALDNSAGVAVSPFYRATFSSFVGSRRRTGRQWLFLSYSGIWSSSRMCAQRLMWILLSGCPTMNPVLREHWEKEEYTPGGLYSEDDTCGTGDGVLPFQLDDEIGDKAEAP